MTSDHSSLRIPSFGSGSTHEVFSPTGEPINQITAHQLLTFVIAQAINDGMLKLAIGYDSENDQTWMKYYGPVNYSEDRTWWEMIPPPFEVFPAMLQYVISLTSLEPAIPLQGTITSILNEQPFLLRVKIPSLNSFEFEWPKEIASSALSEKQIESEKAQQR